MHAVVISRLSADKFQVHQFANRKALAIFKEQFGRKGVN